jgi:hypothetical protein
MNLNSSLNVWVEHIYGLTVLRQSKYQGQAINGFKDGKSTKPAYELIDQHMKLENTSFSLDTDNVAGTLFKIFKEADPLE